MEKEPVIGYVRAIVLLLHSFIFPPPEFLPSHLISPTHSLTSQPRLLNLSPPTTARLERSIWRWPFWQIDRPSDFTHLLSPDFAFRLPSP